MESLKEGNLHKWFNSSKSKDGKKGWVNVVTGGTCASDKKGEGTPKCVSSSKRASMTKAERLSASRRKKKADPGQQQKTGAAKPTYVSTDKKKMKEETSIDEKCWDGYTQKGMKKKGKKVVPNCVKESDLQLIWEKARKKADKKTIKRWWDDDGDGIGYEKGEVKEDIVTESDKKGKGSGKKDACYKKVKASAKVWPSAYASGRLVQCRKKGAANYGNSKSESYSWRDDFEFVNEGAAWQRKSGKNSKGGLNEKGRKSYEAQNPGSDLKAPVTGKVKPGGKAAKRRKSFCARMGGMKGPMKKPNGKPTRKALALRKWKCRKKS